MITLINNVKALLKTRRIHVFFIFFIISFSILLVNKLSRNYIHTIYFKVIINNVPNDIVLNDTSKLSLPVAFENTGFNWLKFVFTEPKIELNLEENFTQNKDFFLTNISKSTIVDRLPKFSKNIEIIKHTLKIGYAKLASKRVPIVPKIDLEFSPGYDTFNNLVLKPDSILIIGSEKDLQNIKAVNTEKLRLTDLSTSLHKKVLLKTNVLPNNVTVSNKYIMASVKIVPFTEGIVKVPINVINKPDTLNVAFYPKQVTVSYYVPLSDFKQISKEDFLVDIDFNTIDSTNNFIYPELNIISTKIKSARIKESKIEYIITK